MLTTDTVRSRGNEMSRVRYLFILYLFRPSLTCEFGISLHVHHGCAELVCFVFVSLDHQVFVCCNKDLC